MTGPRIQNVAGRVPVTCWCERKVVYLPADRVGVDTASCGHTECVPPVVEESAA